MAEAYRCPQCGVEVPGDAPQGLCPNCLLNAGLQPDSVLPTGSESAPIGCFDDPFVPPTPAELAPHFPDLEILEMVGRGGMGVVYKARQKQLDRLVALKILAPEIGQHPAFAERFGREAQAMAMLSHPHVVAVHDFGQAAMGGESKGEGKGDAGVPLYYFLMEYVDGVDLRRLLDTGKLAPKEALAIVPQICDALQYAHDHGVVHRDIKPENVLLDKDGRVKIADFGIAKLVGREANAVGAVKRTDETAPAAEHGASGAPDESLTGAGQIIGTPQYMAPEQIEHPLEVDHRADIYSLGVVFYQMLTGELPIGRFAPPSKKVQIDVRLDEVVLRALEREPQRRYQQAGEIKMQVETIATTSPEHRLPPAIQDAAIEPARLQVRGPAIGLLVTGMFNCLTIPMTVLVWSIEIQVGPRAEPSGVEIMLAIAASLAFLFITLIPGVFTIFAALKMKRLEAYGLALAASILAIITSPISCLIGLPIGIWALLVLSQREVRTGFAQNRKRTIGSASASPPDDAQHPDVSPPSTGGARGTTSGCALIALILLCVVIGSAFLLLGVYVILGREEVSWDRVDQDLGGSPSIVRIRSSTEAGVAVAEHPVGPWNTRLHSGVMVELLGVAENPSTDRPWWQPDGSSLAQRPYGWLGASVEVNKDEMAREFAVRLSKTPSEPVGIQWKIDPSLALSLRDPPGFAESASDVCGVAVRMIAGQQTADVHIGVAAGAWQTAAESQARGGDGVGGKDGVVSFSPAEEVDGSITITVAHDMIDAEGEGPEVRVIAVDLDGREHNWESFQNGRSEKLSQLTATFSKLSLKDVKAFHLQTRPYQWAKFLNVALQAGQEIGGVDNVKKGAP